MGRATPASKRRREELAVADVERARERSRESARVALGVTGRDDAPSFREGMRTAGTGWYPVLGLGALAAGSELQGYGLLVLGPEISDALGVSRGAVGFAFVIYTLMLALAGLGIAAVSERGRRRATIAVGCAIAWSTMTIATGLVTTLGGLLLAAALGGAATASARTLHRPILLDNYPPPVRVRADAGYRIGASLGTILAAAGVVVATSLLGLTWRGAFVALGGAGMLAALIGAGLRDPGYGRWDAAAVRRAIRKKRKRPADDAEGATGLGFFEIVRRTMLIPTVRRLLVAHAVFGMFLIPLQSFLFTFLEERWDMGPASRGMLFAALGAFAIVALALIGPRGDAAFRRDPSVLLRLAGIMLAVSVSAVAAGAASPFFAGTVLAFGVATGSLAALSPLLAIPLLSIVAPRTRAHAAALIGVAVSAVGGFGGMVLLQGIESRFGITASLLSLAVPGLVAAWLLRSAASFYHTDLDRMIDEIIEEERINDLLASGSELPMLACRGIDFSYGQLQVLFDVSFTVDDGEMVALLGTNGAGKSTLLRVISGLGLPTKGSVRFRGADITYLDAERRLRLGITQIPGGRAIFRSLDVVDNLRTFGYSYGRNRRAVDSGIEETLEAFPALAERKHLPAGTLSGGEQQMVGLGKAFILRPRLLLIDELSLGLAPKVVSELLQMVRRINEQGTAVVLVEQSVNVALSLVDHAYFMEKGEIRFDGRANELVKRTDLLRSVFLEGAAKGLRRR